jgi:hypothetical protein
MKQLTRRLRQQLRKNLLPDRLQATNSNIVLSSSDVATRAFVSSRVLSRRRKAHHLDNQPPQERLIDPGLALVDHRPTRIEYDDIILVLSPNRELDARPFSALHEIFSPNRSCLSAHITSLKPIKSPYSVLLPGF